MADSSTATLIDKALNGDVACMIFWLKTRTEMRTVSESDIPLAKSMAAALHNEALKGNKAAINYWEKIRARWQD
jgi:hypothetical protein